MDNLEEQKFYYSCHCTKDSVPSHVRLISKWLHVIRFFAGSRVHCVSEIITGDIEKSLWKKCSKILWMKIFVSCTSYKITNHCHFSSWEAFSFEWCNVIQYISCVCLQPSRFCCRCDKLAPFVNNLYSYIQILLTWAFLPSLWGRAQDFQRLLGSSKQYLDKPKLQKLV